MPNALQRHRVNSSLYHPRTSTLAWHVEWLLGGATPPLRFHHRAVDGALTWRQALTRLLTHTHQPLTPPSRRGGVGPPPAVPPPSPLAGRVVAHHPDAAVRAQLQRYAEALEAGEVRLCLRVPMVAAARPVYWRLGMEEGINESLVGRTLIEYPTVDVVMGEVAGQYPEYGVEGEEGGVQEMRDARGPSVLEEKGEVEEKRGGEERRVRVEEMERVKERAVRNNRVGDASAPFKRWA